MSETRIRDFDAADWPLVWPIIRAVCTRGDTFTYPVDIDEGEARDIWIASPPGRMAVAVDHDGNIVGTSKMGPNHRGPGAHVATASFMVAEPLRGSGIGRRLVLNALEWAESAGFRGMQFNAVAESNEGAIALYRSLGFSIIGTVPQAFRHPVRGYVGLCIMYKPLAQARAAP